VEEIMVRRSAIIPALLVAIASPFVAEAQTLGTFRWQLQPFCNIVSVTVTQSGGVYRLEGTDDQCGGGADMASVIGTAFQNPDGTIGFGLNIVSSPGGAPVHVEAAITLPTLSGSWRDSAGNSGAFVITPAAGTSGSPRPASGTIGALAVNPAQVQLRVSGACGSGLFMQSIAQNGTVGCGTPAGGGTITGVAPGFGLSGGGISGTVSLSLSTNATGAFNLSNTNGLVSQGTFLLGGLGATGAGVRMIWYPGKAAFRAGSVTGTHWDDANIGSESVAFNKNTTASGVFSAAFGDSTVASGNASFAFNKNTTASGSFSTAFGDSTVASGLASVAMGAFSTASGNDSMTMGRNLSAAGDGSVVLGTHAVTVAAADGSFIFADRSTTNDIGSFAPNEFIVRAAGGVGMYSNATLTSGVELPIGGSSWSMVSDVNMKEHFRDIGDEDVLSRIAKMPVREWSYKTQNPSIRHMGPTAQDFYAAFGLGENPLRINTIDADGVALAAVRALEVRTRELQAENQFLRQELADLKRALDALASKK
jgi:hypothetical protein